MRINRRTIFLRKRNRGTILFHKINMRREFKIISHFADIKLSVESGTLESLFRNSLSGMNELLKKGFCKNIDGNLIFSEIEVASYNSTSLLINFLSEVLTLSHMSHVIFCSVEFVTLSDKYLLARLSGTKVDKFDNNLKAVSFHEAEIIKNHSGNYQTNIVFDYA